MKTYVISRMYAGAYLEDNLGGEIINLLHDDYKNNYISVEPKGYIPEKYNDTVNAVILTRLVKAGIFEIIGVGIIGKNGQVVKIKDSYSKKEKLRIASEQVNTFLKHNKIEYAGIGLQDITGIFTFKTEKLLLPKQPLYLIDETIKNDKAEGNTYYLKDKRFPVQSLVSYITNDENLKSFSKITQIIEDESLWNNDRKNEVTLNRITDEHYNFLSVIHKEYDELAYSNLFFYVFSKCNNLLIKFAKEILNVKLSGEIKIIREKDHIDLWIEDSNNIIVIENKIRSGINGVSIRHDFSEKGLVQSQLDNYWTQTEKVKGKKKAKYFIFIPDYNKVDLSKYSGSMHYEIINYRKLYDFFKKQKDDAVYYDEFVKSLYKHTKDRENDYAEDMKYRLLQRIKKVKAMRNQ